MAAHIQKGDHKNAIEAEDDDGAEEDDDDEKAAPEEGGWGDEH